MELNSSLSRFETIQAVPEKIDIDCLIRLEDNTLTGYHAKSDANLREREQYQREREVNLIKGHKTSQLLTS